MSEWHDISDEPVFRYRKMPVLFYSGTVTFWSDKEPEIIPDRDNSERYDLGYWDGRAFCYSGSNHEVFERLEDRDDPNKPTHWTPLQKPPSSIERNTG